MTPDVADLARRGIRRLGSGGLASHGSALRQGIRHPDRLRHDVYAVQGDVVPAARAIVRACTGDGESVGAFTEGRAGPDDAAGDAHGRVVVHDGRAASVNGDVHDALIDVLHRVQRDLRAGKGEGGDRAGGVAPVGGAVVHVGDP